VRSQISALVLLCSLFASPLSRPAIASPIYRVSSEVAQGHSGPGLTIVLAPGQLVAVNFSQLGEKIASVAPGDRSQFVFTISGAVLNLRRIKPLIFEGEYSGSDETTVMVTTIGSGRQRVYPIAIRFSNKRPAYRVVEISPDFDQSIPLTLSRAVTPPPYRSTPVVQVAILPDEPIPVPSPPPKASAKTKIVAPVVASSLTEPNPEPIPEPTPKLKPKPEVIAKAKVKQTVRAKVKSKARPLPIARVKLSDLAIAEKRNNHQLANAIVLGVMASKLPPGSADRRRAQDAIYLLRLGRSLDFAARKSGLTRKKLELYIARGTHNV
jgi:hypothetical protein